MALPVIALGVAKVVAGIAGVITAGAVYNYVDDRTAVAELNAQIAHSNAQESASDAQASVNFAKIAKYIMIGGAIYIGGKYLKII